MGKRMFDAGEQAWPQEAPFHTPAFVVTHEKRDPWERPVHVAPLKVIRLLTTGKYDHIRIPDCLNGTY